MKREERIEMYNRMVHNVSKEVCHLVAKMSVTFEDELGSLEFHFSVPLFYAMEYFNMSVDELEDFLNNEYTSEDSAGLLDKAYLDGKLLSIF